MVDTCILMCKYRFVSIEEQFFSFDYSFPSLFITVIDRGRECALSKIADDAKLSGAVETL